MPSRGPRRYTVIVASIAEEDIHSIWTYIAGDSVANADRVVERITVVIDRLEWFPQAYPRAPESKRLGRTVRHAIAWPYRVVFEVRGDRVVVYTVRHGHRGPWTGPVVG